MPPASATALAYASEQFARGRPARSSTSTVIPTTGRAWMGLQAVDGVRIRDMVWAVRGRQGVHRALIAGGERWPTSPSHHT